MKVWKYIHADDLGNIEEGKLVKSAFVYQDNSPGSDYDDVTTEELILEYIDCKYDVHEINGKNYFKKIRRKLVFEYQTGVRTDVHVFEIDAKLKDVRANLILGDWMSSKNELVNNVVVSGALDQELYDEILTEISNYIVNEY